MIPPISPRHFHYPLFHELPLSLRILYTNVLFLLGFGYIFGLIYVYQTHSMADKSPGLSVRDIQIVYHGEDCETRLESALRGPMSRMVSEYEKGRLIDWVVRGASREEYDGEIKTIFDRNCMTCHGGTNPNLISLKDYDAVLAVAAQSHGANTATLVRVSHIHLFGVTLIFAMVGLIFSHAYVGWPHVKSIVLTIPFVAVFLDIAAWWLTKYAPVFGYLVMFGGVLMAVSFAFQWGLSLYQMWFYSSHDAGGKRPD